jgi:hypothetical protein
MSLQRPMLLATATAPAGAAATAASVRRQLLRLMKAPCLFRGLQKPGMQQVLHQRRALLRNKQGGCLSKRAVAKVSVALGQRGSYAAPAWCLCIFCHCWGSLGVSSADAVGRWPA